MAYLQEPSMPGAFRAALMIPTSREKIKKKTGKGHVPNRQRRIGTCGARNETLYPVLVLGYNPHVASQSHLFFPP
jgi:hypothetical protein